MNLSLQCPSGYYWNNCWNYCVPCSSGWDYKNCACIESNITSLNKYTGYNITNIKQKNIDVKNLNLNSILQSTQDGMLIPLRSSQVIDSIKINLYNIKLDNMYPSFSNNYYDYCVETKALPFSEINFALIINNNSIAQSILVGQALNITDGLNNFYIRFLPSGISPAKIISGSASTKYFNGYYLVGGNIKNPNTGDYYAIYNQSGVPVWFVNSQSSPASLHLANTQNSVLLNPYLYSNNNIPTDDTHYVTDIKYNKNVFQPYYLKPNAYGYTGWSYYEFQQVALPSSRRGNILSVSTTESGFYIQEQTPLKNLVWDWDSKNYFNGSSLKYAKLNSIDVHPIRGDLLVSARSNSAVFCIDYSTKNISWILQGIPMSGKLKLTSYLRKPLSALNIAQEPSGYSGILGQGDARWQYNNFNNYTTNKYYNEDYISIFDQQSDKVNGNSARGVIYNIVSGLKSVDTANTGVYGNYGKHTNVYQIKYGNLVTLTWNSNIGYYDLPDNNYYWSEFNNILGHQKMLGYNDSDTSTFTPIAYNDSLDNDEYQWFSYNNNSPIKLSFVYGDYTKQSAIHCYSIRSTGQCYDGGSYTIVNNGNNTYSHVLDFYEQDVDLIEYTGAGFPIDFDSPSQQDAKLAMNFGGNKYRIIKSKLENFDLYYMRRSAGIPLNGVIPGYTPSNTNINLVVQNTGYALAAGVINTGTLITGQTTDVRIRERQNLTFLSGINQKLIGSTQFPTTYYFDSGVCPLILTQTIINSSENPSPNYSIVLDDYTLITGAQIEKYISPPDLNNKSDVFYNIFMNLRPTGLPANFIGENSGVFVKATIIESGSNNYNPSINIQSLNFYTKPNSIPITTQINSGLLLSSPDIYKNYYTDSNIAYPTINFNSSDIPVATLYTTCWGAIKETPGWNQIRNSAKFALKNINTPPYSSDIIYSLNTNIPATQVSGEIGISSDLGLSSSYIYAPDDEDKFILGHNTFGLTVRDKIFPTKGYFPFAVDAIFPNSAYYSLFPATGVLQIITDPSCAPLTLYSGGEGSLPQDIITYSNPLPLISGTGYNYLTGALTGASITGYLIDNTYNFTNKNIVIGNTNTTPSKCQYQIFTNFSGQNSNPLDPNPITSGYINIYNTGVGGYLPFGQNYFTIGYSSSYYGTGAYPLFIKSLATDTDGGIGMFLAVNIITIESPPTPTPPPGPTPSPTPSPTP
jgi:hypothetical protein